MFKAFSVYRIRDNWQSFDSNTLEDALSRFPFKPCGPNDKRSAGWVAPRQTEHSALVENIGGQYVFRLMVETRSLPASAVRAELEKRLAAIETQTGKRPRGQAKRELKEQVEQELLPRAFSRKGAINAWLDPEGRWLYVGTTSTPALDGFLAELMLALDDELPLVPLSTAKSPSTAMAQWLVDREAPGSFDLERECELRQPDDNKATVRYVRHDLDNEGVSKHIAEGKLPVHLAMAWAGRVSFVLTETLRIKKLKFLTVPDAEPGAANERDVRDDSFDADVALATGELRLMLPELVEALGGEVEQAAPVN